MSSLLLNSKKPGVQFEDKWHELKPTVNKLLKQQAVTTQEWQNLFWWVYNMGSLNRYELSYIPDRLFSS